MLSLTIFSAFVIAAVAAEGELQVLSSSESVHFHGHDRLTQETFKEVVTAAFGFTVQKTCNWQGVKILDPFSYCEAVVVLLVDGVPSLGTGSDAHRVHHFPLTTTEHEEDTWHALRSRIEQRFPHSKFHNNSVYRIDLQSVVAGEKCPLLDGVHISQDSQQYEYLDPNVDEDAELMKEVQVLRTIAKRVETKGAAHDGLPDLYWIVLPALHSVSDLHGAQSEATREAKRHIFDAASLLSHAFSSAYDNRVVVATLATDSSHTRRARSPLQTGANPTAESVAKANVAEEYSEDYPVIFNIMLWFGVTFVFALLAIAVAIADMDPGRDSIIYRMTSTRMKKDN